MERQYISPYIKIKQFTFERKGIMLEATFFKGDDDGPSIGDGDEIEAKQFNFNVWEEE